MNRLTLELSRRGFLFAMLAAILTATAAGAATIHRFGTTQTMNSAVAQTVLQTSATASAFQGKVGSSSTNTAATLPFGVLGDYDVSGSTFGVGTLGISTTGYGVAGESFSSNLYVPSVLGYSGGGGAGVEGISNGTTIAPAVFGIANGKGDGGDFYSETRGGVFGETMSGFAGVGGEGVTSIAGTGLGGVGYLGVNSGEGVLGFGYSGTAAHPAISAIDAIGGSDLVGAFSCLKSEPSGECSPSESFIVQSASANRSGETAGYSDASDVQMSGDLYVYGRVYENCVAFPATKSTDCNDSQYASHSGTSGVTRSASGTDVKVYAPTQGERTVEDFGTARLANGHGFVPLDPAYAATISPQAPYLVFVTPDGDCRGLFVSGKTSTGFTVSELGGGRSTLTFDYRIVAKPLGDTSRRFAAVAPKPHIPAFNVSPYPREFERRAPFDARKIIPPVAVMR